MRSLNDRKSKEKNDSMEIFNGLIDLLIQEFEEANKNFNKEQEKFYEEKKKQALKKINT